MEKCNVCLIYRGNMAHKYNQFQYNSRKYSAHAEKVLTESVNSSDALSLAILTTLYDWIFNLDTVTKQFANKGLSDSIRLNDWMSKNRQDESEWTD